MRQLFVLAAFCFIAAAPAGALAQEATLAPSAKPSVELVEDQEAGVVRVVIAGKEILRVDAQGLHVTGDIDYSGVTTDVGPEGLGAATSEKDRHHAP